MVAGRVGSGEFGASVDGIGDLDGDDIPEFLVGAPSSVHDGIVAAGAAFTYSKAGSQLLYDAYGWRLPIQTGYAVARAGDVDGDSICDLLIGSPSGFTLGIGLTGIVSVYSGANGRLLLKLHGEGHFDLFGAAVASAGDVDGDLRADIVVGAFGASPRGAFLAGRAYVFSGANGGLITRIDGTHPFGTFGMSVAGVGDADGDGIGDIAVGAPFEPGGGVVHLVSAVTGSEVSAISGDALGGGHLGTAVAPAGDIDADGRTDVIMSAPVTDVGGSSLAGISYVYSFGKREVLLEVAGEQPAELFGQAVANAGDVDGDGTCDVVAGGPLASPGGKAEAGVVRVFSGKTGMKLLQLEGASPGLRLGQSVGGLGDIDGDGLDEIIVGAPGVDTPVLENVGAVYILGL
jgi:hypothetical protein